MDEIKKVYRIFGESHGYETLDMEMEAWLDHVILCYSMVFTAPYAFKIRLSTDMAKPFHDFMTKRGEWHFSTLPDKENYYIYKEIKLPESSITANVTLHPKCIEISWLEPFKPHSEDKTNKHCADCLFYHPKHPGSGTCGCYDRKLDHACMYGYHSDQACKYFKASSKPKALYLRTKYDGVLHCPKCGRNFNWSNKLRISYVEESIANYIPDRPTNHRIRVFKKSCNFCEANFKFLYDKVTDEYKYFTPDGRQYYAPKKLPGIGENDMGPDNMILEGICLGEKNLLKDILMYEPYACCKKSNKRTVEIKKVIFNNPATVVIWKDGTKTVVKRQKGDRYDKEKGLAMAFIKRTIGLKEFYKQLEGGVEQ